MANKWIITAAPVWVTRFLQNQGKATSKMIWQAVQHNEATDIIHSRTHLKQRVLKGMYGMNCLQKVHVPDPSQKIKVRNGWMLNEEVVFKYIKENPDD